MTRIDAQAPEHVSQILTEPCYPYSRDISSSFCLLFAEGNVAAIQLQSFVTRHAGKYDLTTGNGDHVTYVQ